MNGAESLVRSLVAGGIDTCFTNPGTSEMHMVAALEHTPEIRCLLTLFEGVATGAADGYARMTGKPACTLLHLGPGLANGVANLHNARRAQVPIVNVIGDHATFHLQHDAPLTSDIEGIAKPVSGWVRTSRARRMWGATRSMRLLRRGRRRDRLRRILWRRTRLGATAELWQRRRILRGRRCRRARRSSARRRCCVVASGRRFCWGTMRRMAVGLAAAGRIAAATGAKLLAPYPFTRLERGAGRATVERIPYIFEQAAELLKEFRRLILVGARVPYSYFAHPQKKASPVADGCEIFTLAREDEDCAGALEALAEALGSRNATDAGVAVAARPDRCRAAR